LIRFAALVALLATAGVAHATPGATVRVSDVAPLTVVGGGFLSHERVTVRVRVAGRWSRRAVTAGALGRFRVAFPPLLAVEPCRSALLVVALGSSGRRATARRACSPPDPQPS